jgi:hypothetical protein
MGRRQNKQQGFQLLSPSTSPTSQNVAPERKFILTSEWLFWDLSSMCLILEGESGGGFDAWQICVSRGGQLTSTAFPFNFDPKNSKNVDRDGL